MINNRLEMSVLVTFLLQLILFRYLVEIQVLNLKPFHTRSSGIVSNYCNVGLTKKLNCMNKISKLAVCTSVLIKVSTASLIAGKANKSILSPLGEESYLAFKALLPVAYHHHQHH